jgi:tRNA-dihydrouridine synthase
MTSDTLLSAVDAFLKRTGMAAVTFGREAMNDPHFVRDLRNGRRVWPETDAKVRGFMRDHAEPAQAAAA